MEDVEMESPVLLYLLQLHTQTYFKNIWQAADTPHTPAYLARRLAGFGGNYTFFYLTNFINGLTEIHSSAWSCLKRKPANQINLYLSKGLTTPLGNQV